MEHPNYPFEIRRLDTDEGGGWLITFPDLPGCMSDGETIAEAITNGADAERCWLETNRELGYADPEPGSAQAASGRLNLRMPKSLHARIAARAEAEGVSLNTLLLTILAEGMGKRQHA